PHNYTLSLHDALPISLQLDEVVQAMLVSLQPRSEKEPNRELASLQRVAQELRDLPREQFRAALKSDLQRRASMSESTAAAKTGIDRKSTRLNSSHVSI